MCHWQLHLLILFPPNREGLLSVSFEVQKVLHNKFSFCPQLLRAKRKEMYYTSFPKEIVFEILQIFIATLWL